MLKKVLNAKPEEWTLFGKNKRSLNFFWALLPKQGFLAKKESEDYLKYSQHFREAGGAGVYVADTDGQISSWAKGCDDAVIAATGVPSARQYAKCLTCIVLSNPNDRSLIFPILQIRR